MRMDLRPWRCLHDLQQVAPALGGEALQPPVIEDQQGDPAQAAHQTIERAFVAGTGERRDQLGDAAIEDGLVLAAGLVGERAGDERLSRSRWPAQDQIVTLADPVAGGELGERGPGDATPCAAVDVLDVGTDAQLSLAQMAEIALVIAVLGFALDHHGEAVVEAELVYIGDVALLPQGLGHSAEAELQQAIDIGLSQGHGDSPSLLP